MCVLVGLYDFSFGLFFSTITSDSLNDLLILYMIWKKNPHADSYTQCLMVLAQIFCVYKYIIYYMKSMLKYIFIIHVAIELTCVTSTLSGSLWYEEPLVWVTVRSNEQSCGLLGPPFQARTDPGPYQSM